MLLSRPLSAQYSMVQSPEFYNLYQQTYLKYTELYGAKVCVFLRKGSFYEFYGQQDPVTLQQLNTAKEVIEQFGIVLHSYPGEGPNGTTGLFAGVPEYTLDKWASKLTKQGWTVVVIDEIKNGSGKVSRREVTKVLSAGTHIEAAEQGSSFHLAALWLDIAPTRPPTFGAASADLTTGQVFLYEGEATGKADAWHTDDLRHFFQVYAPKEVLLFCRGSALTINEEALRRTFYIPSAPIHIRNANPEHQGAFEKELSRETYLRELFQPRTSLPLKTWLRTGPLTERALTGLLRFAEDHAPKLASCLQAPTVWHPKQNLQIINNALTQLNLIGTQDQTCVEDLFVTPQTPMGKRSLRSRLCTPLADADEICARQQQVDWILALDNSKRKEVEAGLTLLYDISRLHRCIVRGTVRASDILQLYQTYQTSGHLMKALTDGPLSPGSLPSSVELCLTEFVKGFDQQKALKAQAAEDDLGFLKDSVAPLTAAAEKRIQDIYTEANSWISELRAACGCEKEALYFKPTEKNMFCIHATKVTLKQVEAALKKSALKETYVKLSCKTLSSAGRIEHPALDQFQERLDAAQTTLKRCLEQEVPAICIQYTKATREVWQPLEDWLTNVDLVLTMAKTAQQQGWVKPTIETGCCDGIEPSRLVIEKLRHPLIETQNRQSKYVTHDIQLGHGGAGQGWLLYGMNASGKSSLMKAIGLAVLLAQIGSYVPAKQMTLRPFHRIATRILNQDNLWAGLSSFAVEMSELREILSVADHQTLVLGDELCSGTESISGTAIVAAGIQHLHKAGARFVLATHLHDLMKLKAVTSLPSLRVWHLHVEYDPVSDILIYHRSLKEGAGSSMYGLEVAKALHLPRDMIDTAFSLRRELLGELAVEDAQKSQWSSKVTRYTCSSCNTKIASELEVHHIEERHKANGHRNEDGLALNHVRNLVTLCQVCHDKHHANLLHVGPVEDTSEGPKRQIVDLSAFAYKEETQTTKTKFSKEQCSKMQETVKQHPGLHTKLLVFQIQREHQIQISEAQLKLLMKKGLV